jgi:ABC-type branched-subunit amino acid transport system ATPase component
MMLELKDITLSFTGGKDTFKILNGLNFSVEEGKVTALIGGNGAGKTTLFNIISGFQEDFSGDILFKGKNISKLSPDKIARKGIGRLFQGKPLLPDLTLLENMKLASGNCSGETPFTYLFKKKKIDHIEKKKEQQVVDILIRLFGENNKYLEMLHHNGSDFSYGEQRLISLARLFMGDYSLLLLDEPTAGVNPVLIDTIKHIILQLVNSGKVTVLLIEHNMQFLNGLADNCAFLSDGVIQCEGKTEEILSNQTVKNSYLGL